MNIKAAIFDLSGVYFTDGRKIGTERISKKYKLPLESVEQVLRTGTELGGLYRRGKITAEEFWKRAVKFWKIKADPEELSRLWNESYAPIDDTIKIIRSLKKKGIRLYFLSDNTKERSEYLQARYNFLSDFEGGIFSYEVHMTKKDGTAAFQLALEKTNEKAENVVMIDDREEYVKTAKKVFPHVILFRNPEQIREELEKLGLKISS